VVPKVKLNDGNEIPILGLGTWRSNPNEVKNAVVEAVLHEGYRHLDLAEAYLNEAEVGEGLKEIFELSNGKIKREDLFLTSKLWNTHHDPKHVAEACKNTLKNLGVSYLDLYLIHWPYPFKFTTINMKNDDDLLTRDPITQKCILEFVKLEDTWKAMEKLVEDGLVKSIGVSNFPINTIIDMLSYCKIKPVVNQVEVHPYFNQSALKEACQMFDIKLQGYSPLGSGSAENFLKHETMLKIAKKHGKSTAQVALRWNTQRGVIILPKSVHKERLRENINIFDFELDEQDMKEIDELQNFKKKRFVDPLGYFGFVHFD